MDFPGGTDFAASLRTGEEGSRLYNKSTLALSTGRQYYFAKSSGGTIP